MRNLFVIIVVLLSFFAGYVLSPVTQSEHTDSINAELAQSSYYTCPMHSHVHESSAGNCPICGMSLIEDKRQLSERSNNTAADSIYVKANVINNFGIKTAEVKRGTLYRELLTYGYVNKIESASGQRITTPISGKIVTLTGKDDGYETKKGELLVKIASDSWQQLQQDYLDALDKKDTLKLRRVNQKLLAANFLLADIQQLKNTRKPTKDYFIYAKKGGILANLQASLGQQVNAGDTLFELAPIYPITGYAEVFEGQWRWLETGHKAGMIIRSVPNVEWQGEVLEVDDMLMNRSRTIKAKLGFKLQPGILLKSGMQANFTIYASPKHEVLYVPQDAVIRTGGKTRVMLALGNGRFKPLSVRIGLEDGQRVEILEDSAEQLKQGMKVVSSGQFLLDSESQLNAELQRLQDSPTDADTAANSNKPATGKAQ